MDDKDEILESLKQHIHDSSRQSWLFGAGISKDANIPLMYPLTDRVKEIVNVDGDDTSRCIIAGLTEELCEGTHVEHYLSHLGDLIALAERSRSQEATLNQVRYSAEQLINCHRLIVSAIGDTVRYGYIDEDNIGTLENPVVEVAMHDKFIRALMRNKVNLERRSTIKFFSTNYDTLLEDALSLNKINVIDGFAGGALGFWSGIEEFSNSEARLSCKLHKLHGSVDWVSDKDRGLVRARYGTKYLSDSADIMIYPQATKYVETQKDPFAFLFSELRKTLQSEVQNVFITCGYSFGDEHINAEIENCLTKQNNKTTFIAFTDEKPTPEGTVINSTLDSWLTNDLCRERIFVAGKNGVYNGSLAPLKAKEDGDHDWWRFDGLVKFLEFGEV